MKPKVKLGKFVITIITAIVVLATPISSFTVLADEQNGVMLVSEEEILLPVGGISPLIEIPVDESEMSEIPVTASAQIKLISPAAYVQPQVPGGTNYGYYWVSNSTNRPSDYNKLSAVYEALVTYSDAAYASTNDYVYASSYYHAGALDLSSLELPIDVIGGSIDSNGTNTKASMNIIRLAWAAFGRDNPQYYMFENGYSYSTVYDSSRGGYILSSMYPVISAEYVTYSERKRINAIIETKFAEYQILASTVNIDFEKARIVHDKMLAERDYSYVGGAVDSNPYAHNILGVLDLSTHGPVCESYAEAYAYILNRLGINTITIFGASGSGGNGTGGHAWNLVQIGGDYYYVDSTWNDFETVGNPGGSYNDEGNLKNALYYRYFMVGSSNTNFTGKHSAGTPDGNNLYYLFGLPAEINSSDYDTLNGSSYKWLMDNGRNNRNSSYTYGPEYSYYIGYTDNVGYPTSSETSLFAETSPGSGSYYWNGWMSHDFGSYTVTNTATDIPVVGALWEWSYNSAKTGFNNQFYNPNQLIQDTDYEIIVEKPYHAGENRAYIYGKGSYKGIDFAVVNLTFGTASAVITDLTVSGAQGTALSGSLTATITLTNASVVRGGLADVDATSWFDSIPTGVTARATAASLSDEIEISFSGTPTDGLNAEFEISIPSTAQTSGANLNVASNSNAKFSITALVNAATPVISVHPQGATYTQSAAATAITITASIADSATGGTLSYQWYSNTIDSTTGGMLVGTSATYTPPTTTVGMTYYYVVVTNTNNTVNGMQTATATSDVVSVTVIAESKEQTNLKGGTVGIAYSVTLPASNNPTSWRVSSGSLPTGLTLDNYGVISGTPTTAGIFAFNVIVTNEDGTSAILSFCITIAVDTPKTGIADVAGFTGAMFVFLVISAALWGHILFCKYGRERNNG